jgi:hypothetical protein
MGFDKIAEDAGNIFAPTGWGDAPTSELLLGMETIERGME